MSDATNTEYVTEPIGQKTESSYHSLHQLVEIFVEGVTEEPTILERVALSADYGKDDVVPMHLRAGEKIKAELSSQAISVLSFITESPGAENRDLFDDSNRAALYEYAALRAFEHSESPVSKNTLADRIQQTSPNFDKEIFDQSWASAKSKLQNISDNN